MGCSTCLAGSALWSKVQKSNTACVITLDPRASGHQALIRGMPWVRIFTTGRLRATCTLALEVQDHYRIVVGSLGLDERLTLQFRWCFPRLPWMKTCASKRTSGPLEEVSSLFAILAKSAREFGSLSPSWSALFVKLVSFASVQRNNFC